ncbi:MAG TPA: hypothetical protein VD966_07070 [Pyrinomonadaceae bacterium]|nr:hypothetical protein [Pyrinomonadaceae bacterium]
MRRAYIIFALVSAFLFMTETADAGSWASGRVSNSHGSRSYKPWIPARYTG